MFCLTSFYGQGQSCVDFEALEDGTTFSPGGIIDISYDVSMSVRHSTGANSGGAGSVSVLTDMYEGLDGLMLKTDNALALFKTKRKISNLTIALKEVGGEVEVHVDKDKRTFPSIAYLEGSSVGAAKLSLVYGTEGQPVGVTITGSFDECAIGGTQVWLDNLCTSGMTVAGR
ncbi:hypothetical protein AB9P05_23550 [Roseivirga sp. BDSF3-8]|uniref:hypothetical protein n=1 Tax=Roseivirga sp. BDSF3-8 TaxID=3241598 RepID=UPI0035323F3E